MLTRATTTKPCRSCEKDFTPRNSMATACSPRCAMRLVAAQKRAEKDEMRARRLAIKPRSGWLRAAQSAFNAWVRVRDAALPCVSCLRHHEGQYHAGHYLSTGACPELRFDEANVHKQCSACNTYLSGNIVLYRNELIRRIGQAEVDRLEGPHPPAKWSIDELRCIKNSYRILTKQLLEKQ